MRLLSSKPSLRSLSDKQVDSPVVIKPAYVPKYANPPPSLCSETVPFVVPESFQFFVLDKNQSLIRQPSISSAPSSTDYAYLHLEVMCNEASPAVSSTASTTLQSVATRSRGNSIASLSSIAFINQPHHQSHAANHVNLDLICWKVIVTKAMAQQLGASDQTIPTDIIHIINPRYQRPALNKRRRPQRRYLSSNGSQSSLSDTSDASCDPSHPTIVYKTRSDSFNSVSSKSSSRRNSTCSTDEQYSSMAFSNLEKLQQYQQQQQETQQNPEAWIRVPESELTNAWTALSGFATTIDTGNYGTLNVGVRVIRASRYLPSVGGSHRNRW